jgi:hypothetical protein
MVPFSMMQQGVTGTSRGESGTATYIGGETLDSTSNCHDRVWFRRDRSGATSVFGVVDIRRPTTS